MPNIKLMTADGDTVYVTQKELKNALANIQVDVTADVPMHLSINENGGLRITYDDGSDA